VTQPPPLPPRRDSDDPPNPWRHGGAPPPPRPSWPVPVLVGAAATVALHSPILLHDQLWLPLCITCGCSGVPVGFVPAFLAGRRDPGMGAGAGFAVAFLAVALGAVIMAAVAMIRGFAIDPELLETIAETWRTDGRLSEDQITEMLSFLDRSARFMPAIGAALVALSGGVCGAVVGAFARRRRPPSQDP
jgi:hypothetical protein